MFDVKVIASGKFHMMGEVIEGTVRPAVLNTVPVVFGTEKARTVRHRKKEQKSTITVTAAHDGIADYVDSISTSTSAADDGKAQVMKQLLELLAKIAVVGVIAVFTFWLLRLGNRLFS